MSTDPFGNFTSALQLNESLHSGYTRIRVPFALEGTNKTTALSRSEYRKRAFHLRWSISRDVAI